MKGEIFNTYWLWNEINQILNCGWRFKSEYYDHRSCVKQPKQLKNNLKKKSCLTGNFCFDQTPRSIHRANQANWRAGHCEFLIYPMVEMTWVFFQVLFQPLRLFTRITCFIYYEDHIHFHTYWLSLFSFKGLLRKI